MNAYYLLPKEREIHFTAHIAHISFWGQFSCCMIVINIVLPHITDMNDISSADCEIFPYLCSSSTQNVLLMIERMAGIRGGKINSCACSRRPFRPKTTATVTLCFIIAYSEAVHICVLWQQMQVWGCRAVLKQAWVKKISSVTLMALQHAVYILWQSDHKFSLHVCIYDNCVKYAILGAETSQ